MAVIERRRLFVWGSPAILWALFTFWYTDFGGPLSDDEVASGIAVLTEQGIERDALAEIARFLEQDTGRQFLMVNNIEFNDAPPSMPGFAPGATAQDYQNHYMEHMYPELLSRACHPIFFGSGTGVVVDVVGVEDVGVWDASALMRYRSRRDFLAIVTHPDIGHRHMYKLAAMSRTIAYPVEPVLYVGDLRLQLLLVLALLAALTDMVTSRARSA